MPRGLTPHCGDNVTLRCEASLLPQEEVKLFSLGRPNMSCQHGEPRRESWCESAGEHPRLGLTLTLVNVMPVDQGQYLCKLRSTMGVYYNTSALTVQGGLIWIASKLRSGCGKVKVPTFKPCFQIASRL